MLRTSDRHFLWEPHRLARAVVAFGLAHTPGSPSDHRLDGLGDDALRTDRFEQVRSLTLRRPVLAPSAVMRLDGGGCTGVRGRGQGCISCGRSPAVCGIPLRSHLRLDARPYREA